MVVAAGARPEIDAELAPAEFTVLPDEVCDSSWVAESDFGCGVSGAADGMNGGADVPALLRAADP